MADLLFVLLRVNLVASAMILVVLAARRPARQLFGPRVAYGLWLLPPLAAAASLLPAKVIWVAADQAAAGSTPAVVQVAQQTVQAAQSLAPAAGLVGLDIGLLVMLVWLGGVLLSLAGLALRQGQFLADARKGRAGPAVAGVLKPRIVVPADFAELYSPKEQAVVLAHEAMHLTRHDPRVIAVAAVLRCLNWFNPLVHLAVFYLRIDQELACDAQVIARHPNVRRAYADAMLKTQLTALTPLPLGCLWPAGSPHPLAERIKLLTARRPGVGRSLCGAGLVAIAAIAGGYGAWSAQPAQIQVLPIARPAVVAASTEPKRPISQTLVGLAQGGIAQGGAARSMREIHGKALASVPQSIPAQPKQAVTAQPTVVAVSSGQSGSWSAEAFDAAQPVFTAPVAPTVQLALLAPAQPVRAVFIGVAVPAESELVQIQSGAPGARVLPWTGGERLVVNLGADVRYVAGPEGKVMISGRPDVIDDIVVDRGVIRFNRPRLWRDYGRIQIIVTTPRLSSVTMNGSGRLAMGQLAQDHLDLTLSGSGRVTAAGAIRSLRIDVSGSGDAQLTGLTTNDVVADVSGSGALAASGAADSARLSVSGSGDIDMAGLALNDVETRMSGSGSARVAPKLSADVRISGSGSVRLLSDPARLTTQRSGSGRVIRAANGV